MTNLYKITLRHTHADGHEMDYDVKVEADSAQEAVNQCCGPNRWVVNIRKVFRLNHVQVTALIITIIMSSLFALTYYLINKN